MTSTKNTNLASRAGHWSATHRKRAIFGWLAFVLIATVLGGSIGTTALKDEDSGNGQSQVADRAIADAGFVDEAGEQVLVQAKGSGRATDPAVASAVRHLLSVRHPDDRGGAPTGRSAGPP